MRDPEPRHGDLCVGQPIGIGAGQRKRRLDRANRGVLIVDIAVRPFAGRCEPKIDSELLHLCQRHRFERDRPQPKLLIVQLRRRDRLTHRQDDRRVAAAVVGDHNIEGQHRDPLMIAG